MRFTHLLLFGIASVLAAPVIMHAQSAPMSPAEQSRRDGGIPPFTAADVAFMQGMIGHHGQAVIMAGWAADHGARADVQRLAERIKVGQQDEIEFMQNWLRDRQQPLPTTDMHQMHGDSSMAHDAMMPGMLSSSELAQLDAARGPEFDRLFLTLMIRHHLGAITMVERLFGSPNAANDDDIFKFASDVGVDQTTEVDRMQSMLATLPPAAR